MAQFDVHPNPSKHRRSDVPWVVDVLPLASRKNMPAALPRALCPVVQWEGEALVALPHMAAPFRTKDLGPAQGSLQSEASALVAAIDAVIRGI